MNDDRIIELLRELLEKMGGSPIGAFNRSLEEATKGLSGEAKQRKINEVLSKNINDEFAKFDKSLKLGRKSLVDLGPTLDRLEEQLEEMGDGIERTELEQRKNVLASQYLTAQYKKSAGEISAAIGKVFVGSLAKTAGGLVRSLQGNASGAALAGELLTNTIDFAQSSFSTVAKAGTTLGTTLALSAIPQVRTFGVVTATASVALEGITSSLSELAKFGIQVMVKEVEKTVKAFNETSAAGALFTGGMEGVRKSARDAGLTVDQFASVIKTNSAALGETGLTVTEAVKRMGNVGKVIKSSGIETSLMKLGFGFEEQAGLIAEVMASMRRSGVLGTATNAQIAEATEKYATNLRIIANITGQDAKQALAQAEKKNQQYAVDAKLRKIAQETGQKDIKAQFDAFIATIEAVAPDQADAYRQMLVTSNQGMAGVTTNLAANMTGYTQTMDKTIQQMYTGAFSAGKALETQSGFAQKFSNNIDEIGDAVGIAGQFLNGQSAEYARGYTELQSLMIKLQDPKAAIDAAEKRKEETNKATNDLLNAEIHAQRLRIEQEAILTGQLAQFAKVVDTILGSLEETVKKYMGQFKEKSIFDGVMHVLKTAGIGTAGGAGIGAARGAIVGGVGGSIVPGAGTVAGAGAGALAGALTGGAYGLFSGAGLGIYDVIQGNYAAGGIVHRPEIAMIGEGGNSEAVVPLPDNRSIPVKMTGNSMDTKEMVSAIQQQSGILNQILTTMEKNNQLTSGILQTSY